MPPSYWNCPREAQLIAKAQRLCPMLKHLLKKDRLKGCSPLTYQDIRGLLLTFASAMHNTINKAIFLDRDGVINHDPGDYTKSVEEFEILPGVLESLKEMKDLGYRLIVVTNQGGVAKGLYPVENVYEIHEYLQNECRKHRFEIDAFYYAPYHDDYGNSLSRKPGSLMVERGLGRFNLDPSQCFLVGDKDRDIECGEKVGVKGIRIETNAALSDCLETLR